MLLQKSESHLKNYVLIKRSSLMAQSVNILPAMQENAGWEDSLEKRMTTHSSILAWRIPEQRKLTGLHFMEMKVAQSCPTLCNPMDYAVYGIIQARILEYSGVVGSCSLFQRIFPTQGLNTGLPLCRWILYQLSHQGTPIILEWLAYPFSSGSS